MKNILVPVDFSESALNALVFALRFAQKLDYEVKVLHVYSGSMDTHEPLVLQNKPQYQALSDQLNEFIEVAVQKAGVDVKVTQVLKTALMVGRIIMRQVNSDATNMVILGRIGKGRAIDRLMGSLTATVAQQSKCPVLIVPENTTELSFDNILYAANFESADERLIKIAVDFGRVFGAGMHFVHVGDSHDFEFVEKTFFEELFKSGDPDFAFHLLNVDDKNVMHGLTQYAKTNNIDLVILVNYQRDFWNTLLQRSMTQKMSLTTEVPLLVFHKGTSL